MEDSRCSTKTVCNRKPKNLPTAHCLNYFHLRNNQISVFIKFLTHFALRWPLFKSPVLRCSCHDANVISGLLAFGCSSCWFQACPVSYSSYYKVFSSQVVGKLTQGVFSKAGRCGHAPTPPSLAAVPLAETELRPLEQSVGGVGHNPASQRSGESSRRWCSLGWKLWSRREHAWLQRCNRQPSKSGWRTAAAWFHHSGLLEAKTGISCTNELSRRWMLNSISCYVCIICIYSTWHNHTCIEWLGSHGWVVNIFNKSRSNSLLDVEERDLTSVSVDARLLFG